MAILRCKTFVLIIILSQTTISLCSISNALRRSSAIMDRVDFKDIAKYSKNFLLSNINKLACQKNESGFVRINIPISKEVQPRFKGVKKIRANYWAPEAGVSINPESIHTHPSYFESLIVKGGYNHEIYELSDGGHPKYDLYQILKNGTAKNFVFIGQASLRFKERESVGLGDIKIFNKDNIHRVLDTTPNTLSLNVVFEGNENEYSSYDLYLSKDGVLGDIKTTRDLILNEKSQKLIEEVAIELDEFVKSV